jgi:hypothetical protein
MITVIPEQSLFDIAVQKDGSALAAFDWALANGLSITDELFPGQQLIAPNSGLKNIKISNYFKGKKQMIATSSVKMTTIGIGKMKIGKNFIVR